MLELVHSSAPQELTYFIESNDSLTVAMFDSIQFSTVKTIVKASLNELQSELCAYCENTLSLTDGHIDHIKPKGGKSPHPELTFIYNNYAHSCNSAGTCGNKKKAGLLPIEPRLNCNNDFTLTTDGEIIPNRTLSRKPKHPVKKTIGMLGLNKTFLIQQRKQWLDSYLELLKNHGLDTANEFISDKPFRAIMNRLHID